MKPLTALQLLAVLIMSSLTSLSLRAGTLLISCNTPIALLDPASELKALVTADGTSLTTGLRFTRLRAVYPFSDLPLHLYTIEYDEQTDGDQLQADLLQSAAVIRATPNHRFRCQQLEEDPLRAWQWGLERVEAPSAWVEADGNGVVLAVIDTGIDWTHPDLQENIWFNLGEDNGNGTPFQYDPEEGWLLDPQDANGIDDDGNGLVDDVIGFDFTDAPEFPAPGDYLEPDRDPADEHRHGTIVASVAGAVTGNSIGIAAVAPGVTVMPLRAGNSLGFLQEDDVAAAIIYATLNGAQVINMSFGDTEVAPILHDVIQYASSRGVVMVASTGNDGSSQLHFPSAWPEVISVGAVTSAGYRWQLSNYGLNLDLVAPGDSILAAIPGAGYAAFSGTSLAAPFVSGAVAILLDAVPTRTPTLLKNILRTSAVDIGPPGYDNEYGAGILNIPAALATPVTTVVSIAEPAAGSRWQPARQALLEISGSAAGNFFASWLLQLGPGDNPHDWTTVASSVYQQLAGPLALIDLTTLADTSYTLKLEVQQLDGSTLPAFSSFTVDRTPPEIVALSSLRAVQASSLGRVFEIELTDPVTVELHYAPAGSQQYHRLVSPFTSTEHCLTLLQSLQSGLTDLFFQAISSSGDSTRSPLLICELPTAWYPRPLHSRPANLPYGLLLNRVTDFNQNSHPEVWLTAYDPLTHFPDLLQLQEYDPAGDDFVQLPATWGTAYIKDLGDIDGDGTLELLSEIGGISYLFTQTNLLQPPDQLAWRSESHWAGNFITPGPVDNGYPNVLLRSGGSPRHYLAARFSSIGDSSTTVMTTLDTLFNPFYSPTEPFATGVARGVEGDFDNDSNVDLLLSDNEGHIFIYEYSGPQPQLIWQHEEPGWRGPGNMIAAGNFSQTDYEEFIVVWRTATPQSEHEVAAGRWLVAWYDYATSNDWRLRDTIAVIGMYHGETRENGIAVGDIDGDGLAEIILTLFPDMYLFDICDGRLVPIAWQG
ncbi:S8 family serine peptidase, partial [bacterium]|nr:S8 family serine peptidase [bacterium]